MVGYVVEQNGSMSYCVECFWAAVLNTVVYILNRTGTLNRLGRILYKLWYEKELDKNHLKNFVGTIYSKQKIRKLTRYIRKKYLPGTMKIFKCIESVFHTKEKLK